MKRATRVLISGAGPATFGILKGLRYSGEKFHCAVAEVNALAAGNYVADEFFIIQPVGRHPQQYVSRLFEICRRRKMDLLIPTVSEELLPLAKARGAFEASGIRVLISDPAAVATSVDKWKTYEFCRLEGIHCPATALATSREAVRRFARTFGFPICIKPRQGRGSAGFVALRSGREIDALPAVKDCVVQKYVESVEYSTDVLLEDGRPRVAVPRERMATDSGISMIGRTVKHRAVSAMAMEVCEQLGLEGVANVQIKLDRSRPTLLEVNPRFAGTTILSVAAGVNFPYLAIKNFLRGERFSREELRFRQNVYLSRFLAEVFLEKRGTRFNPFEPDRA